MSRAVFVIAAWGWAVVCACATVLTNVDARFFLVAIGAAVCSALNAITAARLRQDK